MSFVDRQFEPSGTLFGVFRASLLIVPIAGGLLGVVGCGVQPPVIDRFAHAGSEAGARGDFDDLETSIDTGLTKAGVAPVHWHEPVPGTRVYELRTARDQPGELVVVVGAEALADGSVPVELRCRIGRFGEPELERRVMSEIANRLEELRGREVYRIEW